MRRRTSAALGAAAVLFGMLSLLSPSSAAAQDYTASCNVLSGSQDLGNITVGQRFAFQLRPQCTFTAGASATITANGVSFTKPVNANGFVDVTVNVISETVLEVNPQVPARCGVNTISAVAPSTVAAGRQVVQTATFNLLCAGAPGAPTTPARSAGVLSRTGSDVLPWAAGALGLLMAGAVLVVAGQRRVSARG